MEGKAKRILDAAVQAGKVFWAGAKHLYRVVHGFFSWLFQNHYDTCATVVVWSLMLILALLLWIWMNPERIVPTEVSKMMQTKRTRFQRKDRKLILIAVPVVLFGLLMLVELMK